MHSSLGVSRRLGSVAVLVLVVTANLIVHAVDAVGSSRSSAGAIEGVLRVAHGDDFSGRQAGMRAEILAPSRRVPVRVAADQHTHLMQLAGRRVRATESSSAASGPVDAGSVTAASTTASSVSVHRTAVVLLRTKGTSTDPFPASTAQSTFFGASGSVADWFTQASNAGVSFTGQVFGWYTSSITTPDCTDASFLDDWLSEAATRAAAGGYVAANFDDLVVYTPRFSGIDCDFSGIAWVGSPGVLLNGAMTVGIAAHELGHNLGVWHAGTLSCSGGALGGSCTRNDYGDSFDTMGQASLAHGYNAVHKYLIGWIPSNEVQTVTAAGAHTIQLTSSERPVVSSSTELIVIPRVDGSRLTVERREPYGTFDSTISGVYIRVWGDAGTDDTQLLDMTPATATFDDAALAPGMTFNDPDDNLSITTISDSGSAASIEIDCTGTCGPTTTTSTTTASTTTTTVPVAARRTFNCSIRSSANGRWVSAELGAPSYLYAMLRARSSAIGPWEKFVCIPIGTDQWAFRSRANGRYVSAELGYPGVVFGLLRARASRIGLWETFRVLPLNGCSCDAIRAAGNAYVSTELFYAMPLTTVLRARASTVGSWERFTIVPS